MAQTSHKVGNLPVKRMFVPTPAARPAAMSRSLSPMLIEHAMSILCLSRALRNMPGAGLRSGPDNDGQWKTSVMTTPCRANSSSMC